MRDFGMKSHYLPSSKYIQEPGFFSLCLFDPIPGPGLPLGALRSHSLDTPHSGGLFWTSDQPETKTSTWQHTTLTRDKHPCLRRDSNPQSQQASGRRPTPYTAWPLGSEQNQLEVQITDNIWVPSMIITLTTSAIGLMSYRNIFPSNIQISFNDNK